MLQLFGGDSLQNPLKSLYRPRAAIKIVLLKRTSLTDKDYKATQILPLSSRLMSNKARFVHKIVSGRAPIYLSTKLLINQSSRNSSRKLNVPIPRIDLFKSGLVYLVLLSGTHCPANWGFQSVHQCLKSVLRFICYLSYVLRETMIIYVLLQPVLCCFRQPIHFVCPCALCACSFRRQTCQSLILCACARIYMFTPDQANFYMYIFYIFVMFIIYLFLGLLVSILTWFVWMYMYSA